MTEGADIWPQVLNLGLPKSGTTTLTKALRRSELRVADWRVRKTQSSDPTIRGRFVGEILYDGYFNTGDPLHFFKGFGAIGEMSSIAPGYNYWPQTDWGLIEAILTHHPDVKFLLTAREPALVADSMMRWNSLGSRRLPRRTVPGLPAPYGGDVAQLTRWIEGHYSFCLKIFEGTDRFLAFDPADPTAPKQISAFLGRPLPWWGQANKNRNTTPEEVS